MKVNYYAAFPPAAIPASQPEMVTATPASQLVSIDADADWSSGLCGCCHDVSSCCLTCWCPCITFGRISDILDRGTSSCCVKCTIYGLLAYFTGCSCLFSWFYRSKLRSEYRLNGSHPEDLLVHCCCERCALCQEYRELEKRGFNLSIGWERNRQNGVAMTSPGVEGGMRR